MEGNIEIFDKDREKKELYEKKSIFAKKIILAMVVLVILIFVLIILNAPPGTGMVWLVFPYLLLPICIFLAFPIYLIFLVVQYIKYLLHKSSMHLLDKITFYFLLIVYVTLFYIWLGR